ncbi:MAG: 4'-phosphopantetheinyl transferase superfamily protein [Tannerellaceae bacterium]|jgi:phosphopantetheinyl transferase|nr:4'-phosphopantetheinyl transferase superfamily protein [Tannerellaceae bacterium]
MPLYLKQTLPLMGVWKVNESVSELLSLLTQTPTNFLFPEKIRTENRKTEWLAVRVLLKELLGEETVIAYYNNGAPYLPEKDVCISISHTKGYVAVQLVDKPPVGIDIEYRANRILNVRSRFLSPEENSHIDPANEADHLLIYWCAKETLFKMMGRNEVDFAKQMHIIPFPYKKTGSLVITETHTPQAASYLLSYRVDNDFVLVFCEMTE